MDDRRLEDGATQFNAGDFFAAHETWEAAWLDSIGAEKELLHGLVQIAAGYAKVESGIRSGALKLLTRGLERLAPWVCVTPALQGFVGAVSADLERVRRSPEAELSLRVVQPPRIVLRRTD
jgi:hypothetical protein